MKKNLLLAFAALVLTSCGGVQPSSGTEQPSQPSTPSTPSVDTRKEVPVFILIGQSNMEGNTRGGTYLETYCNEANKDYRTMSTVGYQNVLTTFWNHYSNTSYNYSGSEPMEPNFLPTKVGFGVNRSYPYFGPELGMAEVLDPLAEEEQPIHFIKFTSGGTGFMNQSRDGISNWNWQNDLFSPGYLYSRSLEYIDNSLAELEWQDFKPVIKGICWAQGCHDGGNQTFANFYYENLKNMVEGYREYFAEYADDGDGTNIAFLDYEIYAGLNQAGTAPLIPFANEVNAGKRKFAAESDKNFTIPTAELGLTPNPTMELGGDMWHLGAGDMIKLGEAFANIIKDNIELY